MSLFRVLCLSVFLHADLALQGEELKLSSQSYLPWLRCFIVRSLSIVVGGLLSLPNQDMAKRRFIEGAHVGNSSKAKFVGD